MHISEAKDPLESQMVSFRNCCDLRELPQPFIRDFAKIPYHHNRTKKEQ